MVVNDGPRLTGQRQHYHTNRRVGISKSDNSQNTFCTACEQGGPSANSPSIPTPSSLYSNNPILLTLPTETILSILSHIPDLDLPIGSKCGHHPFYNPAVEALGYVRQDAHRALSQTCRAVRTFFLPLLWENFDVYTKREGTVWYKRVSRQLEKGSLFLADPENKVIASYIRTVRVVLIHCSTQTVLPAFVDCLSSLPNVHTLHILYAHSEMTTQLKNAFEGSTFPSIRKITLPSCAHNILRCCPNVTFVKCVEEDGSKLIGAITKSCKKVEALERIEPNTNVVKSEDSQKYSKSKTHYVPPGLQLLLYNPLLKPLQHLSAIDLINPTKPIITDPIKDMSTKPAIKAARQVLKGPEGQRRLGMMYIWQEKVNEPANVEGNWAWGCWSWKERRVELSALLDQ
ncbi:hypothetical protein M422DRAFT_777788 [Sphaerobolus stellatus SS14]|nr:hypothetical protein M422DRAFT_777788 [Sphaerobolus stellatus SS14]